MPRSSPDEDPATAQVRRNSSRGPPPSPAAD